MVFTFQVVAVIDLRLPRYGRGTLEVVGAIFHYVVASPTPAGCHPMTPPPPDPNLENVAAIVIALMVFIAGGVVSLAARQRDHRTSEVLNGWQQIAKFFRN